MGQDGYFLKNLTKNVAKRLQDAILSPFWINFGDHFGEDWDQFSLIFLSILGVILSDFFVIFYV